MLVLILFALFMWFLFRMAKTANKSGNSESSPSTNSSNATTSEVLYTDDSEWQTLYMTDPKRYKVVADYFQSMEKIQKNASLLYQAGITSGEPMDELISQCRENIELFDKWKAMSIDSGEELPVNVPAFKRLAIIYDRQGKYDLELEVCKEAIARGLDMGMESRAAKCAKKLGIELNDDTITAMMK